MAEVELRGVTTRPRGGRSALVQVSLRVADGELLALLGPSGSGKTTMLRVVAGLEDIGAGEVRIGGEVVNDVPANRRDLALVTEQQALLGHLDLERNIGFGLKLRGMNAGEIVQRVRTEARVFGLSRLLGRRPSTLSAGQQQAASVARATVRVPTAYLLDEPLSRLDARERVRLRTEIAAYVRGLGVTTLMATNDQGDALAVADRIAVLRAGCVEQVAAPAALYQEPVNVFVATFVGDPGMNVLHATLEAGATVTRARVGDRSVRLPGVPRSVRTAYDGSGVLLGVRPEHLDIAEVDATDGLPATVQRVEYLGATTRVLASLDGSGERVTATGRAAVVGAMAGERVSVRPQAGTGHLFDPDTEEARWHGQAEAGRVGAGR